MKAYPGPGKEDEENSLVFEGRGKTCPRNISYNTAFVIICYASRSWALAHSCDMSPSQIRPLN